VPQERRRNITRQIHVGLRLHQQELASLPATLADPGLDLAREGARTIVRAPLDPVEHQRIRDENGELRQRNRELVERIRELEARLAAARHAFGEQVPRPLWWGGYRIVPDRFEFWQGRENRLHDRLQYRKHPDGHWIRARLAP